MSRFVRKSDFPENDNIPAQENIRKRKESPWKFPRLIARDGYYPIERTRWEYICSIACCVKNKTKFIELFCYGDNTHQYVFKNRDGYDLSLLNMLADYCEGNFDDIDGFFRDSALWREKWDKDPAYRRRSINKAIFNYKRKVYNRQLILRMNERIKHIMRKEGAIL